MKISSSLGTIPDALTYKRSAPVGARPTSGSAARLESSDFLSEMQSATSRSPWGEVRADKVAAAKADIQSGNLGSDADFAATIDALLREL